MQGATNIPDLQPLANLIRLTHLNLTGASHISDLSPLSNLLELRYLDITNCSAISSLQPLQVLTNLEYLSINRCLRIQDLSPLNGLFDRSLKISITGCDQFSVLTFMRFWKLGKLANNGFLEEKLVILFQFLAVLGLSYVALKELETGFSKAYSLFKAIRRSQ